MERRQFGGLDCFRPAFMKGRAWIELSGAALENNVRVLRGLLPRGCELMAAVKANAYGHGAVQVSRELNRLGVRAFCVASVSEGVELRKKRIRGEILVLGYTHPEQFHLLRRYRLSQSVIDYAYALELNRWGKKIKAHVAVDTGMHRLGERCENIEAISRIFSLGNLRIEGIYTHLCASDTADPRDKDFTLSQGNAFFEVLDRLKERGVQIPRIHIQASYGLLNYPGLSGDYARMGIALYGMLSTKNDTEKCAVPLEPVLTLKARIMVVKHLYKGEYAGYGLQFTAGNDMKLAVLAIGYADGLPRSLSCGAGSVLIDGRKAPVIGRVCMDQTLVDVSDIPGVEAGQEAVIIGRSGDLEIGAWDIADSAGTISNEILSRLGPRLERYIV